MSDTKKLRQAVKDAGFRQAYRWLPRVFNDNHKNGTRRLKLWDGDHIFAAPVFAQQELERQLKRQFPGRYLYGMFIACPLWIGGGKSFIVQLVD